MKTDKKKEEFSKRLNLILDAADVPIKGKGRQMCIGKQFDVTDKAAWKWLNGEAIPKMTNLILIVEKYKKTGVSVEWLLSGSQEILPHCFVDDYQGNDSKAIVKFNSNYLILLLVNWSELSKFLEDKHNKSGGYKTMPTNENVSNNAFMVMMNDDEFFPYLAKSQIAIIEPEEELNKTVGMRVLVMVNHVMMIMDHRRHDTSYLYPMMDKATGIKISEIDDFQLIGIVSKRVYSKDG